MYRVHSDLLCPLRQFFFRKKKFIYLKSLWAQDSKSINIFFAIIFVWADLGDHCGYSVQNRVKRFSTRMQQNNETKYLEASVDEIWQNFAVGSRSLLPNEKRSNPNTYVVLLQSTEHYGPK